VSLPSVPRDPNRDRRNRRHFSYVNTEPGKQWAAYIAGSTWWCWVHGSIRSKPCSERISGGEVACEYCSKKIPSIVKGYVPLYRQTDYRPCCTVVFEEIRDVVDALALHCRVAVGRGTKKTDPIYVARAMEAVPAYVPINAEMTAPADITSSVLQMWGDRELRQWYELTHGKSDNALSLAMQQQEESKSVPVDTDRNPSGDANDVPLLGSSFYSGLPADKQQSIIQQRNAAFVREAKKPKTNGSH